MSTKPVKTINDITNRKQAFETVNERLDSLKAGFYALSEDYSFHIENTYGAHHKIDELRDNVLYRFFSSLLHYQLLLNQHYVIERRFAEIEKRKEQLNNTHIFYYKKNPDHEYAEKEVSALFDSIVFNLSAIYDYTSILINFICNKDKDQTPSWQTISNCARDKKNKFNSRDIAKNIESIDNAFVIPLNNYRAEIIHRKRDSSEYAFDFSNSRTPFSAGFICSPKLKKVFRKYLNKDEDYTVSYFAVWLINTTADTVAELLTALKMDIESNSLFPEHTYKDPNKPFLIYVDPLSNKAGSPSFVNWIKFKKHFKI